MGAEGEEGVEGGYGGGGGGGVVGEGEGVEGGTCFKRKIK